MLLESFKLSDIPTDVLVSLKHAINKELRERKHVEYVQKKADRKLFYSEHKYPDVCKIIIKHNSENLLSLPIDSMNNLFRDRIKYLSSVLGQDWSLLFPTADNVNRICYVYLHVDPRKKSI